MIPRTLDTTTGIAAMFKALGDPTRLRIFELLRDCASAVAIEETGEVRRLQGQTVGEICCYITGEDRIASTISFHLKELRLAGLVDVERRGKYIIYSVNPEAVEHLAVYFGSCRPEVPCCCDPGCPT
ncbi:MAG: ArsR/SmtB family transcription factor [Capsulimonadaceae bacterium]